MSLPQPSDKGVSERLQDLAPSDSWLQFSSVEKVLGLRDGSIRCFLESITPESRGSTRQQPQLSAAQKELVANGLFFKNGYLAFVGPLAPQPHWGGATKSYIAEPVLRARASSPPTRIASSESVERLPSVAEPASSPFRDAVQTRTERRGGLVATSVEANEWLESGDVGDVADTVGDTVDLREVGRPEENATTLRDDPNSTLPEDTVATLPADTATTLPEGSAATCAAQSRSSSGRRRSVSTLEWRCVPSCTTLLELDSYVYIF